MDGAEVEATGAELGVGVGAADGVTVGPSLAGASVGADELGLPVVAADGASVMTVAGVGSVDGAVGVPEGTLDGAPELGAPVGDAVSSDGAKEVGTGVGASDGL